MDVEHNICVYEFLLSTLMRAGSRENNVWGFFVLVLHLIGVTS